MIRAVDRRLMARVPATRAAALRVAIGVYGLLYVLIRFPYLWASTSLPERQFEPIGVLAWLGDPLPDGVAQTLLVAAVPLGAAFLAGWRFRLTGPLFALVFLVVTTYRFSWGHLLHTEHLVAVHLLVLGATASAEAWSLDARRRRPDELTQPAWPVEVMALVTVLAYLLAGVAKLRNGGWDWLVGDVLRNQVAYDNLRKELLGSWHSPVGGWAVGYGWLFPPMAVATVAVELGAPVALLGGWWRRGWVAGAWLFHLGIVVLMWISFPYQLLGLAYAPLFPVERAVEATRSWWRRPARTGVTQPATSDSA